MKEIDKWKLEEKLGIKGWNFDHLDNRWFNEPLPWSYLKLVLKYLKPNMQLLDMGTGGGELLKKFNHPAKNTQVTEAWEPNIKLLKQTLAIEGVRVIENEHEADIPVADNSLDMITNSHAAFDAELVKQKLKQNGLFITQQVGALNNYSLSRYLDHNYQIVYPDNTLFNTVMTFEKLGFEIIYFAEYRPVMKFFDVGAIVYYASVIPWEFPDFSVENNLCELQNLAKIIHQFGSISTNEDRFIMIARKK